MKTALLLSSRTLLALGITCALGTTACDANHVLGVVDSPGAAGSTGNGSGTAGSAASGTAGAGGSVAPATPKADPATLGASELWQGYIEGATYHSGSSMVLLTFAADANGIVKGNVVFGMGTPPPPATDPDVGYPADLLSSALIPNAPTPGGYRMYIAEGYAYAFDGGSRGASRLQLTINMAQLWAGWCALQTPPSDGSGGCLPNLGEGAGPPGTSECALQNPKTNKYDMPIDCGKFALCWGAQPVCTCTANACAVETVGDDIATFDLFLVENQGTASGSARISQFWGGNAHFVKN
jgi:hypothetical protein